MHSERTTKMDLASWFVCLMGMGVVFLGLICLIFLCFVIGFFSNGNSKKQNNQNDATASVTSQPVQTSPTPATAVIENRAEILAAVSAAIAEELGEDVSSIRILSFRKIGG